jgi:2-polyprenyl-3-methyl-5-hydroxy-6-metoxy-1,4-benzoquinol methylase
MGFKRFAKSTIKRILGKHLSDYIAGKLYTVGKFAMQIKPCFRYEQSERISFFDNYPAMELKAPHVCTSQICNMEFFFFPLFQYWMKLLKIPPRIHRKHWELVYIAQALYENGMLEPDKSGLGFACGKEPLPALFASMGCKILATDLDANDIRATEWIDGNQNSMNSLESLNEQGICPPEQFVERVSFQAMDMNDIPEELCGKFDFIWSCCAIEHIGGMENSLKCLAESMKTLKSGGIAVHTFEFNLSSNDDTCFDPNCFIFRKRDVESVAQALQAAGHEVFPLNFKIGAYFADSFVDKPPFKNNVHLRLLIGKFVASSFGLIIRKG